MNKRLLVNYIRKIILLEQNLVKYNFLISALENSNKSDLLDNINQNQVESQISKLKKFQFQWLINYINSDIIEDVDFPEIIETILEFDKKKNSFNKDKEGKSKNKDIAAYSSIEEIKSALGPSNRDLAKQERERKLSESEIVYKDDRITIYFPHSEDASCEIANRMGSGSVKWCTAADESENQFDYYSLSQRVNLYYILSNLSTGTNLDKISVGLGDNKIIYGNEVTQTADGYNINQQGLEKHFGKEYWNKIANVIINFDKKYVNDHPAVNYTKNEPYRAMSIKDKSLQLKIAKEGDALAKEGLASNPNIDKEVQLILAKEGLRYGVGYWLAKNPNLDKEAALILLKDSEISYLLVGNPKLIKDEEFQLKIAEEGDNYLRWALAVNKNVDEKIALILFDKGDDDVKEALVKNTKINKNKEFQLKIAEEGDDYLKWTLLSYGDLDPQIRRRLELDAQI